MDLTQKKLLNVFQSPKLCRRMQFAAAADIYILLTTRKKKVSIFFHVIILFRA